MRRMCYNTTLGTAWEPRGEKWRNVHPRSACAGEHCVVHNPSNHAMVYWPRHLRETGLVERMCQHGVGHPDPDSVYFFYQMTGDLGWNNHECDGCCVDPYRNLD